MVSSSSIRDQEVLGCAGLLCISSGCIHWANTSACKSIAVLLAWDQDRWDCYLDDKRDILVRSYEKLAVGVSLLYKLSAYCLIQKHVNRDRHWSILILFILFYLFGVWFVSVFLLYILVGNMYYTSEECKTKSSGIAGLYFVIWF